MNPDLLPPTKHNAAEYPAGETYTVQDEKGYPRECTVDDICDFIVEYINSDVLVSIEAKFHCFYVDL